MSWRPLTEILPVVDAGAAQAAILATGGELPAPLLSARAPQDAQANNLFRPGLSAEEEAQRREADEGQAADHERERRAAYEEGTALARAENEALALRYRAAIASLATARDRAVEACERDLVRLSLTIAREVLMADVPGREAFAQRMAEHALHLLQASDRVTLRLHPKDAEALRQHKPELVARAGLTLVEDDAFEVGDVRAEGSEGRVDATLTARLEAMAQALLGTEGASP